MERPIIAVVDDTVSAQLEDGAIVVFPKHTGLRNAIRQLIDDGHLDPLWDLGEV